MLMQVDLHCHTTCSDGELTPDEIIKLAKKNNVKILSITDHDNVDAYSQISKLSDDIQLIPGIEFSTQWQKCSVHIVGLNIDIKNSKLLSAINSQKESRIQRAKKISAKLEKVGLKNSYEKLSENNNRQIGRPDFANLLVEQGIVENHPQAFKKYLGSGKPGDIKNLWLELKDIIAVILESGGVPVLAHPLHYKFTNSKLKRLISDFVDLGGQGLEIMSGYQNRDKTQYLNKLAIEFRLQISVGSDFHRMSRWSQLGVNTEILPENNYVWENL